MVLIIANAVKFQFLHLDNSVSNGMAQLKIADKRKRPLRFWTSTPSESHVSQQCCPSEVVVIGAPKVAIAH